MARGQIDKTWIVLRCASAKTLPLVAALQKRGVHAWTPVWNRKRRLPRSHQSRIIELPCIPSFAFVPSHQEIPARHFAKSLSVPTYSIMQTEFGPILIPDDELNHLRKIADKPREPIRALPEPGKTMRFNSGPFQGLHCIVKAVERGFVTVEVEQFSKAPIKISAFILERIAA
jgi:transcription antitermination factor NusG